MSGLAEAGSAAPPIEADPACYALAVENGERPAGSGACVGHVPLAEVIERFGA